MHKRMHTSAISARAKATEWTLAVILLLFPVAAAEAVTEDAVAMEYLGECHLLHTRAKLALHACTSRERERKTERDREKAKRESTHVTAVLRGHQRVENNVRVDLCISLVAAISFFSVREGVRV